MIKTNAGAKLIKGYALVISNLVIAAIQNREATNAEKKPKKQRDRIANGSEKETSRGKTEVIQALGTLTAISKQLVRKR